MISNAAISYVRRKAEEHMTATCKIERVHKPVFDKNTGRATTGYKQVVYQGKCRIWEVTGQQSVMIADEDIIMQGTQLSIPWDVEQIPRRNDEVEIISSRTDKAIEGKRYVIDSSAKAGEMRPTRRFAIRGVQ